MNQLIDFPSLDILTSHTSIITQASSVNTNHCQINAKNDYQALLCWVNEYKHKASTFRTYLKESERFLLWVMIQKQKNLNALNRDDLEEYLTFLDNPEPKSLWCAKLGGRACKRGDPNWRPFVGPLSKTAKMTAVSSIDSMLNYLVEARYLSFNPLSLIRKRYKNKNATMNHLLLPERMLTLAEWHTMLDCLQDFPETSSAEKNEKMRLIFLIKILFFLGLRINELATHSWNAFRKIEEEWWFYVMGKGDKLARIPVNNELLRAIIIYRSHLKKNPFPDPDETEPLIVSHSSQQAISPRQMNKLLKKLAYKTAEKFSDQPNVARKLKKFSAHWLRHFSASMQDQVGIAFKHIRANHRHENDETTRRYVHAIDKERHVEMQKLKLRFDL